MLKNFSNRVFIDTNVFLYEIFYRNFPENEAYEKQGKQADLALKYLKKQSQVTLYVASFTLVQILSTLSNHRQFPNQQIPQEIVQILENYEVIDFTQADMKEAIALNAPDLEDAFQYTLSQKLRCAYILSENTRDFNQFQNIQVFKPKKVRYMMF
ncbi:MAG: type II toxin-antitoxin system VapC family toxin [Bacteroidetes bacterium]|nr:MAG: type II toxin-antitoxin system VapC family toxin [Bacteroidota bacterium]